MISEKIFSSVIRKWGLSSSGWEQTWIIPFMSRYKLSNSGIWNKDQIYGLIQSRDYQSQKNSSKMFLTEHWFWRPWITWRAAKRSDPQVRGYNPQIEPQITSCKDERLYNLICLKNYLSGMSMMTTPAVSKHLWLLLHVRLYGTVHAHWTSIFCADSNVKQFDYAQLDI